MKSELSYRSNYTTVGQDARRHLPVSAVPSDRTIGFFEWERERAGTVGGRPEITWN
jgi:hypothetical protein